MEPCGGTFLVFGRWRQDPEFKAILGWIVRPHLRRRERRTDGHRFFMSHLPKETNCFHLAENIQCINVNRG